MKPLIYILFLISFTLNLKSQSIYDSTQLMVRADINTLRNVVFQDPLTARISSQVKIKSLSESLNISLVYDILPSYLDDLKQFLEVSNGMEVYYDYFIELRRLPNDPILVDQWALEKIGAYDAWNESVGGKDFGGREPVVAVLDDGFDLNHEDLDKNLFVNVGEVPDNGIDDDNNGYVDDYMGVNIITEHDDHQRRVHGTSVCGIIGADSDNGIGMTGVNWNSQILLVSGIEKESLVIKAAEYLYAMRKRYNDTNGEQGAYLVVNNYSGGVSEEWAEDHPLWCETYDLLGSVGILSIGATTNDNTDIDQKGDMPSTCSSPYLIMVNTLDINDNRTSSGYSGNHIDLGAPGVGTVSLGLGGSYVNFEGTSAAAPHVAGAATLLYTVPCENFYYITISDPAQAALTIKETLLSGVDKQLHLIGSTTSGGRLNIFNSMIHLTSLCTQESSPLSIEQIVYNDTEMIVGYTTNKISSYTFSLFNTSGAKVYSKLFTTDLFGKREIIVPLGRLTPGIYFLTLNDEDTSISQAVFIHK